MQHYIAFLRGINLGNRRLKMDELRARFEELKFANVATFIASGNVIFSSKSDDETKLVRQIEQHLARTLGYPVDTFVRTRAEVAAMAAWSRPSAIFAARSACRARIVSWLRIAMPRPVLMPTNLMLRQNSSRKCTWHISPEI